MSIEGQRILGRQEIKRVNGHLRVDAVHIADSHPELGIPIDGPMGKETLVIQEIFEDHTYDGNPTKGARQTEHEVLGRVIKSDTESVREETLYLKGSFPHLGTEVSGYTGTETAVPFRLIKARGVIFVRDPNSQRLQPSASK